ncbi:MAG: hypothetical protein II857_04105 [Selenomonadaceae bacterium]|nr:hypothetical protein [Selenomonadaceae bacterium]MBQ4403571.1 hypothetical protein [Selenomonadaceae bacterium]
MNQDVQTRDKLIFGEYNPDAYLGGVRYFENLSLDTLNTLLENKFIAAGERQNDAPTTAQIQSFMARYPEYTAHGYAVAITRPDYRVTLEGVSKGRGADSAQELADFTELFKFADELNTATMDCWFD